MSVNPLQVVRGRGESNGSKTRGRRHLKILSIFVAFIVVVSSVMIIMSGTPTVSAPVPSHNTALSAEETSLLLMRDLFNVWQNASYLSDGLQEKIVGSANEWKGQQYVYNAMGNLSLDHVDWETFNTSSWNHTGDKITVVGSGVDIPCTIYSYSYGIWGYEDGVYYSFGNTSGGTVLQARLVDAGYGSKAEFDALGADLHGAIALVHRDDDSQYWPVLMNNEAYLHNASATISYDYMASDPPVPEGIKQDDVGGTIPFFSISRSAAAYLQGLLGGGPVTLRLEGRADLIAYSSIQSSNVIGYLYGSKYPDEYVVISSHIDTYWNGSWDTVAGIACMLEFARIFTEAKDAGTFTPERTLVFCSVGGEESGGPDDTWFSWLIGAYEFTLAHPEVADGLVLELNLDGIGLAKTSGQYWGEVSAELTDFFNEVTTDLGHTGSVGVYHPLWSWTDAWIYGAKIGGSAVELWYQTNGNSIYHTQVDDMNLYSNESIDLTLEYCIVMAARASSDLVYPVNLISTLDWITTASGCTYPGGMTVDKSEVPYKAAWFDNTSAALTRLRENVTTMNAYMTQLETDYAAANASEKLEIEWNATWLNQALRSARQWINHWGIGEGGDMSSWETFVRPDQHSRDISFIDSAISWFTKGKPSDVAKGLTALEGVFTMAWGKLFDNWTYHNTYEWMINSEMYWGDDWDQQQAYVDVWWIWNGVTNGSLSLSNAISALTSIRDNQLLPWLHTDLLAMENAFGNATADVQSAMSPPPYVIPEFGDLIAPICALMVVALVISRTRRRKEGS
jgi:hypothetical protein